MQFVSLGTGSLSSNAAKACGAIERPTGRTSMRSWTAVGASLATGIQCILMACSTASNPAVRSVDETILREYSGAYQRAPNAFVYLQLWNEFTGANQLVAFDESGEV